MKEYEITQTQQMIERRQKKRKQAKKKNIINQHTHTNTNTLKSTPFLIKI